MPVIKVLNIEIGMTRGKQAFLCPPATEAHWQRCHSQGKNKKDDGGAAEEA